MSICMGVRVNVWVYGCMGVPVSVSVCLCVCVCDRGNGRECDAELGGDHGDAALPPPVLRVELLNLRTTRTVY